MFFHSFIVLNSVVVLHSFLIPTFQAMTSHVSNVIYTFLTLIMTLGLCNITFFLRFSIFQFLLSIWDCFTFTLTLC